MFMIAYIKPFFNRKEKTRCLYRTQNAANSPQKRPFLPYFNSMFPGTRSPGPGAKLKPVLEQYYFPTKNPLSLILDHFLYISL